MINFEEIFCLDANVLIQAWQKYYSPQICPSYWNILNDLGKKGLIFMPEMVFEEITRAEDDLAKWLKESDIPIRKIDESVTSCLKTIYAKDPNHKLLADNTKARSLADPWVIAHALCENATVVTKEEKSTAINAKRVKIPNVCENMDVKCMNDFQIIESLKITFDCKILN